MYMWQFSILTYYYLCNSSIDELDGEMKTQKLVADIEECKVTISKMDTELREAKADLLDSNRLASQMSRVMSERDDAITHIKGLLFTRVMGRDMHTL